LDDGSMLVINPDTRLSINADSEHLDAAMKFVEYFTKAENIQRFADQQSSFSPLKGGNPSSVLEIQPLISCYESGRTVIGTDDLLKLPIWDLTAEASQRLLAGESLKSTMSWLDQQAQERIVP
ncbi:MAG: carbohydrate ABC transporter substrate-binding protein, partial [Hungatella sp.]